MRRTILYGFIRDKAVITVGFFSNTLLVALFYRLSARGPVEWLYPLVLSSFLFLVLILFEWFRYYRFHRNLPNSVQNALLDLQPASWEQREAARVIYAIHRKYLQEIADLQKSDKDRQYFISQWIHNMKTPVSVTDLILQRLKGESPDSLPELASDLDEENRKLGGMLDQILNLLRLEDFSRDYVPEPINLEGCVKNVINERKSQFIYNNVFPKLQCNCEPATVLSDRKWNELMIGQIVSNAIKYSRNTGSPTEKSGEPAMETPGKSILFQIERTGGTAFLTIKDEGIGIPSYDLKRVFEPFFTGENGRMHRNATGIGLYLASVIAKRLGHEIRIESEAGKGTSVTISYLSKL